MVNFADLNKVLTNYNLTGPLNINNLPMLAYDVLEADSQAMQLLGSHGISISEAVPEPSSIALLLTLLASLAAWKIARR